MSDALDGKLPNSVIRQIVLAVWPEADTLTAAKQSRLYGDVRDILDSKPTPVRSRAERDAVVAAAARLSEVTR